MPKDKADGFTPDSGQAEATAQPTQAELMAELQTALTKGDFKAVTAISRKIDTLTRAAEKAELDTKRAVLDAIAEDVKAAITLAIEPYKDSGQLDVADGIWYADDFGEQAATLRLIKSQAKARTSTGGGTGKKFDISTDAMLASHGAEEYKDGQTFQQAYEANTDKNWRYAIRQKLLKIEGII